MHASLRVIAVILPALLAALPAEAQSRRQAPAGDTVVAESRFGHGTVSGAVRQGRTGLEVQLPGGTWIACRRSCSEKLRVGAGLGLRYYTGLGPIRVDVALPLDRRRGESPYGVYVSIGQAF